MKLLKKFEYMVEKSVEIVAAKDHQMILMQDSVKALINSTNAILENYGKEVKAIKEKIDFLHQKGSLSDEKITSLTESVDKLSQSPTPINSEIISIASSSSTPEAAGPESPEQPPPPSEQHPPINHPLPLELPLPSITHERRESVAQSSASSSSSSSNNSSSERQDVNQRLQSIANHASSKTRASSGVADGKPVVLVIADSNGQHLNPNLLHKDKHVIIVDEVYTLEKVVEKLPKLNNVSDIVLLVGINNIKRPNATIEGTVSHYYQVCKDVQKIYPNAVIHVGSVAPSCERFIFYNAELEKLAQLRNVPFITALPILEVTPHGLKPKQNSLNGIHYTRSGIKLFANEVKKSLHPREQKGHQRQFSSMPPSHYPGHRATMSPFIPSDTHMPFAFQNELRRFFSMALSALQPSHPML